MANNPTVSVIKINNVNYDIKDAKCRAELEALIGSDTLAGDVDTIKEIQAFLAGIDTDDPTLFNQLKAINDRIDAIEAVSGTVDDALSSTSINPVQNKVIKGALDDKANKSEMSVSKGTGTNAGKTTITLTSETGKSATVLDSTHPAASITDANKTAWNNKQSAINDLDAIRSGAGKGASSVQTVSLNSGTPQSPTNGNVNLTVVTGIQFDEQSHFGLVQLPVYVKKADYDTTIEDVYQSIPQELADLTDDATHRLVTDTEKSTWNNKQNALTFDNTPTKSSANPVKSGGVYSALADVYDGYDSVNETLSFTFPTE